jgi:hypothetical protein
MSRRSHSSGSVSIALASAACAIGVAACSSTPEVPAQPTWADVEPIIQGECAGCHGSTAKDTGLSYRLDFYEMSTALCGDAALALDPGVVLAGTAPAQIGTDIEVAKGARWPKMPPLPSPALADWEKQTLERWVKAPTKGPPPAGNHLPTIRTSRLPEVANGTFSFTAIVDDPDGDPVLGVIEVAGAAFLMNRPGSFAVSFDASAWPAGAVRPTAVLCDGWTKATYDLGPVQIKH